VLNVKDISSDVALSTTIVSASLCQSP